MGSTRGGVLLSSLLVLVAACTGAPPGPPAGSAGSAGSGAPPPPVAAAVRTDGPATDGLDVAAENARPGTPGWRIRKSRVASDRELSAFADRVSVRPGESFRVLASTDAAHFTVTAYRMGWYDGVRAREVWRSGQVAGQVQRRARTDPATRAVSVDWEPSLTVGTQGWPEGMYLLRLDTSAGRSRYVPVVVRSASTRGRVALMHAVNTWQAYNEWGGANLYRGADGGFASRSYAVSFDRPYDGNGARLYFFFEDELVHRAERLGLPLAYLTNVELDADRDVLAGARGLVSMGHDEYWTPEMKRAAEDARDEGTNLAFLGANALYWRVRYEDSGLGPARLLLGYKSASLDPVRGSARTTVRFRDNPAASPESTLVGQLYECFPARGTYTVTDPSFFLFAGTGARRGSAFPGLVGIEADRAYPRRDTPRPMQVVAKSPTDCRGRKTFSTSSYYTVPSGAGVFSAGTMLWVYALRGAAPRRDIGADGARFVRQVTDTLLREMGAGPLGTRHPARDNLDEQDLAPTNTTGAA